MREKKKIMNYRSLITNVWIITEIIAKVQSLVSLTTYVVLKNSLALENQI